MLVRLLSAGLFALFPLASAAAIHDPVVLEDIGGRSVSLNRPAERLAIDDGRLLIALSLLSPDPLALVVAWPHDVNRLGDRTYESWRARFPRIADLPRISSSTEGFALEPVVAARPDVAIFTLGTGPTAEQVEQMETLGIRVVFVDFFSSPFKNGERSLAILGELIGREAEARAFIDFRRSRLDHIGERLADAGPIRRPNVFIEVHAGMSEDCCNSPGRGNFGDYVEFVGGHNIGADILSGAIGRLNIEYVISRDPDLYIATGGPHLARSGGLVLGPGYEPDEARESLRRIASRTGISSLEAMEEHRVFGLMHQLLNSPIDIVAVEILAAWIHPQLFETKRAVETLDRLNRDFLAVPLTGTLWTDLPVDTTAVIDGRLGKPIEKEISE